MNPDTPFTTIGDEPVEARIVAWVLGEASAFEAAELERLCEERAELMIFKRRMLALHGLLAEAEKPQADESWKLPPDKRRAVEEILGDEKPIRLEAVKEKRIHRSGRRVFLAIAACVLLTLFIARLQPWKQTSEAIIEVKPRVVGMSPLGGEMDESSRSGRMTPQFFGTETEKIKSRKSLEKVVENLDLAKRWDMDKEQAVEKLKDSIKTENVRGTDLLKIQVRQSNKQDADEIAREVAYAYKDYREQIEKRDADRQLAELNKAVRDQEDKVEERRKVLATITRTKGQLAANDLREEAIKRGLDAQDYVDARREFETDQQLLQTMKLKQMGETISRKIPDQSVVVHEVPGAKSSGSATGELAANSRKQRLQTELPKELIEGTPKPMNVPNLESPVSGPAGSGSWRSDGSHFAHNEKRRVQTATEPATPPMPSAAPSVRRVMAEGASSNLSLPEVRGELVQREARPRVSNAAAVDAPAQPAEIAMRSDSDADPFADESVPTSRLDALKGLQKTGSGTLSMPSGGGGGGESLGELAESTAMNNRDGGTLTGKGNIDGIADNNGRIAGEKTLFAEKKLEQADLAYEPAGVPVFGGLFSDDDKSDLGGDSRIARNEERSGSRTFTLSGDNTYAGGTTVTGGTLGIGGSSGHAENAPARFDRSGAVGGDDTRNRLLADLDAASEESVPADQKTKESDGKEGFKGTVNFGAPVADSQPASGTAVVRGFQYPTESEPPALPEVAAADSFPKTPATPASLLELDESVKAPAAKSQPPKPDLTKLMEEIAATQEPYSTFSLNISDASFQIAQAALAKGERPDPAGIKVEQFYNAVDYGDPAPAAGQPVACTIEQAAHPVIPSRNLVRIALKTAAAGRSAAQPLRLTLLVDQSGSMTRADRRAAMDTALAGLSKLLTKNDLVSVIGFSRTPRLLADGMTGDKAEKLAELVNQAASEGGTNLEEAIKLGEQLAGRQKLASAQNRIVLFTDGAANLGNADPVRLAEQVKQLRQKGIAFDIAGIAADGLNDELLGELARNGNGRYYVVGKGGDDNFAKQLAGAFRPAAENVKVQVRFNPERVLRYKLIGFEKNRLKTEDFRNDKVDAAELAAEEAGVAIYQVEPNPEGNGELGEVSVRFRDTASGEMVERGWTIPHDAAAPAIDRATPSMQLAALSMFAGEKLKGGPLGEAIDFKQFAEPQANVRQSYGGNARVAEVLRMVDALK